MASLAIAFAAVWAGMSISVLPKHWVASAIAIVSFGVAGNEIRRRRFAAASLHDAPFLLYMLFGVVAIGLAYGMWVSPPEAPTLSMWLGILTGVLLGGILLLTSRGRKST